MVLRTGSDKFATLLCFPSAQSNYLVPLGVLSMCSYGFVQKREGIFKKIKCLICVTRFE